MCNSSFSVLNSHQSSLFSVNNSKMIILSYKG
jgi:hypothetical protein